MRPGTIVSTMLAVAITVMGFALAAGAIRPATAATLMVRRAWFLADLARLDALLTRAAGNPANELRIRSSESGVTVEIDGSEHRLDRLRIESIERVVNPEPLLHVKVSDPYRRDGELWHLIAPFGRRRVR